MGARDRPFPPEGLPADAAKVFRMAYELTYRDHHVTEKGSVDGQGFIRAVRKVGSLEIDVEFHITVPENLIRWWIWIWHEDRVVFNAWSAKAPERPGIGQVDAFLDGPWRHFLRTRHELESR